MVPGAPRTRFTDPALVRLLAELTRLDAGQAQPALADRLGQWLHWTDANALSMALDDGPAAPAVPAWPDAGSGEAKALAHGLTQLRRAQVAGIAQDSALVAPVAPPARLAAPPRRGAPLPAAAEEPLDAAALRRRYQSRQQAMANAIEPLRARIRRVMDEACAPLAKLAALDAVMERVLGPRERALLGAIPVLLEQHLERLLQAATAAEADAARALRSALGTFGPQMQAVLQAELDVRLQPVEGLMAALLNTPTATTATPLE